MRFRKSQYHNIWCVLICCGLLWAATGAQAANRQTALDAYVHTPKRHFKFRLVKTLLQVPQGSEYLIRITSQQWQSPATVRPSLWKHWMILYVPTHVSSTTALLDIEGAPAGNRRPQPSRGMARLAVSTQSITGTIFDVPNAPLTFAGDSGRPLDEGSSLAYSWGKSLHSGNPTWSLLMPMTKAVVRAMDAVTIFAASKKGGSHRVDHFVVTGASKRGLTTWLVAATDPRVVAIIPRVFDMLNFVPCLDHEYRSYGFWEPALTHFYNDSVLGDLHTQAFNNLVKFDDPYSYRKRLTMPKLLINATGGQFFLPDNSQFYFSALPGENHLLYEPNAAHSLQGTDVNKSIVTFYTSIIDSVNRPHLRWTFEKNGSIKVVVDQKPLRVTLWQAINPRHRDFRINAIGRAFHATPLAPVSPGVYIAHVAKPPTGWTAFFVEVTFPGPAKSLPFQFTTSVRVLPNVEPFSRPAKGKAKLQSQSKVANY